MTAGSRIAFRVDASGGVGIGHAMRCLALADVLRSRGARTRFVCRPLPGSLAADIQARGHELTTLPGSDGPGRDPDQDVEATLAALADVQARDWLVVDHYEIDARWEGRARPKVRRILVIDDLADRPHDADALLDQGLYPAGTNPYRDLVPGSCRLILGPAFALLRKEFRDPPPPVRDPSRFRVNVCFGGTDPGNATLRTLRAIEAWDHPRVEVDVIVGSANPHLQEVARACSKMPRAEFHVDPPDMPGLLGRANLGIGAGGSMSWERCRMALPSVVMAVAANQRPNCRALAGARAAIDLGDAQGVAPEALAPILAGLESRPHLLERMGRRAAALVDGRGAERLALLLLRGPIHFRRARLDDARMAWTWRNHPFTRRFSVDSGVVPWSTHERWWSQSVASDRRILLVACSGESSLGVLRFDLDGPVATVSIYLDPGLAGLGLGSVVLREGTAWLGAHVPSAERIHAVILPENTASIRSFVAAGYRSMDTPTDWTREVCHVPARNPGET
jgi:UDP-2,4-diacetamido-2,4,6-trideoxy-beta-L-altropyranose hydrolase